MSKILKRPMFRKGGEVTEGIVSMAVPRGQYADSNASNFGLGDLKVGGNELVGTYRRDDNQAEDRILRDAQRYANIAQKVVGGMGSSIDPAARALIDFGTKYMAARPVGGGGLKGLLTTAAKPGSEAAQLYFNELDKQDTTRKQLAMFGLQQAFKGDESKVTAAMTNAKAWAKGNYEKFKGDTEEEKFQSAFNFKLNDLLTKEKAVTSYAERVAQKAKEIRAQYSAKGVSFGHGSEQPLAQTLTDMELGKIKNPVTNEPIRNIEGYHLKSDDLDIQGDSGIAFIPTNKQSTLKNILKPNKIYGTRELGELYLYEGNNKFKRIYP